MGANVYIFRRKINTATTIYFPLSLPTATGAPASTFGSRAITGVTIAAGDCKISIDGAAAANTTNLPAPTTGANGFHSLALTAAEMNGSVINIAFKDQTATWEWEDVFIVIETALSLGKIDINNPAGDAISAVSSGSNGNALTLTANGSGRGILATGGATGEGGKLVGGASSGAGLLVQGTANADGLTATGAGTGQGLNATGGASGNGIKATGQAAGNGFSGVGGASGYNSNFFDDLEGSEPTAAPIANDSFRHILQFLKRRFFNKVTQTSAVQTQFRDDSTTSCWTAAVSDDGTTQTKAKST